MRRWWRSPSPRLRVGTSEARPERVGSPQSTPAKYGEETTSASVAMIRTLETLDYAASLAPDQNIASNPMQSSRSVAGQGCFARCRQKHLTRRANHWHDCIIAQFAGLHPAPADKELFDAIAKSFRQLKLHRLAGGGRSPALCLPRVLPRRVRRSYRREHNSRVDMPKASRCPLLWYFCARVLRA